MKVKIISIAIVALIFAILIGVLFRINYTFTAQASGGESFRVTWMGARAFLFEQENPYLSESAIDTQIAIYGQPAEEGDYPYRLDIPFYLLIFYFPFAFIKDFTLARALWMSFAEVALFGVGLLSIELADWKPSRTNLTFFLLALLFSFYGLYPLLDMSVATFTALILLLALLMFREKEKEMLGFLLLFGTIHLQSGALLFFFLLFLIITAKEWRVFSIFGMSFVVVLIITLIISSDWVIPYASALRANLRVGQGFLFSETLQIWRPDDGELIANIIKWLALIALVLEWRTARGKDFSHLLWVASLSIVLTPFLNIRTTSALFPLLFLPFVLFLKTAQSRWKSVKWWAPIFAILLLSSWALFLQSDHALEVLTYTFPAILLIALYWMRWWLIRPPRTWADQIK
ncbi:MAG: hypothetical protein GY755_03655 [Chloroflexi bacterium]|nr:hypothetical protein [Chloroflexota bacterium]